MPTETPPNSHLFQETHQPEWFENWFNSPFYPILYQNRNDAEAHFFIDNLLAYLKPAPHSSMLDIACGRGRHAFYLFQKGYRVRGIDLSAESIADAQKHYAEHLGSNLNFFVQDMREPFCSECSNYVFNFFTSFGYFSNPADNHATLQGIKQALLSNAKVVIDFLNIEKLKNQLVPYEEKMLDGVHFKITRNIENGFVNKNIAVNDKYFFNEKVQALTLQNFEEMLQINGFKLLEVWGGYDLRVFDAATADRLIILAQNIK